MSEAISRVTHKHLWCVVIVLDRKYPYGEDYMSSWFKETASISLRSHHVIVLTTEKQERLRNHFVAKMPWNSFARKNVGYLYAITHGAQFIFDFDDDNLLTYWVEGAEAKSGLPGLDTTVQHLKLSKIKIVEPLLQNGRAVRTASSEG